MAPSHDCANTNLLTGATNSLYFQEPALTAHSSQRLGLVRGTEAAERGYIFWRIGERPILQKPHGLVIELPQRPWTFDLVASHHQIKNSISAVSATLR